MANLSSMDLQKIIQTDEGTELLVREADKLGSSLARQLTDAGPRFTTVLDAAIQHRKCR